MDQMREVELPAGSVVHVRGVPVELTAPARGRTHEGNCRLINNPTREVSAQGRLRPDWRLLRPRDGEEWPQIPLHDRD